VKKVLKGWGFNISSDRKKRKRLMHEELEKLENIEEVAPLDNEQIRQRMTLKAELFQILDEEELFWFKRSHERWLLKGDNSTEFFHQVSNGKKRKQTIFTLNHEGSMITGTENLLKHASGYYKSLLTRVWEMYLNWILICGTKRIE
jgi:hypothetical protein